jgi:hypothetical protein
MLKQIGSKREIKINVSVAIVEQEISALVKKYDIDTKMTLFVDNILDNILVADEVEHNNKLKTTRGYKYQFDNSLFEEIYQYLIPVINDSIDKELEHLLTIYDSESFEYLQQVEIFNNVTNIVGLTMYKDGIPKLKLVAFHYLLVSLEKRAKVLMETHQIKMIRGYKTPIEVFSNELLHIIGNNLDLEKFVNTLRSLIENWITKYNSRTKIGDFYYSILMIDKNYIVEKILRYLILTALKNKNPITLRAIFSTYITLIHKNIFSFYALKLTSVKVGYFKQMDALFDDMSFTDDASNTNLLENMLQNRIFDYAMKNKRYFKHNYEFLMDEYSNSFLSPNYFDILYSYDSNFNITDYSFYYTKILKLTRNSFRSQSALYKINSDFFRATNKKHLRTYLHDLLYDGFYEYFYSIFEEDETIEVIIDSIITDILKNINQKAFCNNNFERINITIDEYMMQLQIIVQAMKKLIR